MALEVAFDFYSCHIIYRYAEEAFSLWLHFSDSAEAMTANRNY